MKSGTSREAGKLKDVLLADRLKLPQSDVQALLYAIHSDLADTLNLPQRAIALDIEFLGRSVDLVFTLHRQNLPKD